MKRILWMAVLSLALPAVAFAGSTNDYGNVGGILTGTSAGLTLTGSELISIDGSGGSFGTLSFSTGALTSGSLAGTATFAAGGTFTITETAAAGGLVFHGTFDGPVSWALQPGVGSGGQMTYDLTGQVSGVWSNGEVVSGHTIQMAVTSSGAFNGTINCSNDTCLSGDTTLTSVPEPGTLGLLGTGLVGAAGVLRRKLKS
jgi:PEP-CTERM motif